MMAYLVAIWHARYFWLHLTLADLRSRWRRSYLGVFWALVQPLGLTLLLSFVLSRLFGSDIVQLSVHIYSGVIFWEFVGSVCTAGSLSFVQADAYIKQFRQPLAIYSLRTALTAMSVFAVASLGLMCWAAYFVPQNLGWSWFGILLAYPLMIWIAWPLATLLAYFGARFRDLSHAMGLMLQAVWFVSPVYFEERVFRAGGLDVLVDWNPVYHVLQLFRAPLLHGQWPSPTNYLVSVGLGVFLMVLASAVGRGSERKVIFYL